MTQKATDYWFKPRRYGYGAVFAFIAFARKKTDGEWRWQWGDRA